MLVHEFHTTGVPLILPLIWGIFMILLNFEVYKRTISTFHDIKNGNEYSIISIHICNRLTNFVSYGVMYSTRFLLTSWKLVISSTCGKSSHIYN